MKELAGKSAVVTGASRGIGRASACALADAGAFLGLNYHTDEKGAKQTLELIRDAGGDGLLLPFDVSNPQEVKDAIKGFYKTRKSLDILIANAGIGLDNMAALTKESQFEKILGTNVVGAFSCAKACIKPMIKAGQGRIVFISSVVGLRGNAGQAAYSASKAALVGLTKSLARELSSRKILVNAVAPGYIETSMTGKLTEDQKRSALALVPLGRAGVPEDVAPMVLFLCLKGASYITGQIFVIDGGMTI